MEKKIIVPYFKVANVRTLIVQVLHSAFVNVAENSKENNKTQYWIHYLLSYLTVAKQVRILEMTNQGQ